MDKNRKIYYNQQRAMDSRRVPDVQSGTLNRIAGLSIRWLRVRVPSSSIGFTLENKVFAALLDIQLYGLLKLIKHRNYDVWKGEVTYAKTD